MRVLFVFGTRPEAIKMAPLIRVMKGREKFDVGVCVTAQHRQMLDQVLSAFDIVPDFDLNVMTQGQDLCDIAEKVIAGTRDVIREWKPDLVLVHGDTSTTCGASVAAFYSKTRVAHIEAGLRTGDMNSPWPEEFNRRVAALAASYHFAPTTDAYNNLIAEGISPSKISITGNTGVDAILSASEKVSGDLALNNELCRNFAYLRSDKKLILVTGHRRENFGRGFLNICHAIAELARRPDVEIVYPVHMNPNVRGPVCSILGDMDNVHLIEPQEYFPFVYLMKRSYVILTDSGGIQEEAPSLGRPVLVMRDTTERPEAVDAGTAKLVGSSIESIVCATSVLLDDESAYRLMAKAHNPFGDGFASMRICDYLEKLVNELGVLSAQAA